VIYSGIGIVDNPGLLPISNNIMPVNLADEVSLPVRRARQRFIEAPLEFACNTGHFFMFQLPKQPTAARICGSPGRGQGVTFKALSPWSGFGYRCG